VLDGSIVPEGNRVLFPAEPTLIFRNRGLSVEFAQQAMARDLLQTLDMRDKGEIDVERTCPCLGMRADNGMSHVGVLLTHADLLIRREVLSKNPRVGMDGRHPVDLFAYVGGEPLVASLHIRKKSVAADVRDHSSPQDRAQRHDE